MVGSKSEMQAGRLECGGRGIHPHCRILYSSHGLQMLLLLQNFKQGCLHVSQPLVASTVPITWCFMTLRLSSHRWKGMTVTQLSSSNFIPCHGKPMKLWTTALCNVVVGHVQHGSTKIYFLGFCVNTTRWTFFDYCIHNSMMTFVYKTRAVVIIWGSF